MGSLHTESEHKEETIDGHKTTKNMTTTYTYDLTGNRKTMNDGTDSFTYQYDPYGRLSSVKKGTQDYQSYTYDAQGRTKAETTYWYAGSTRKIGNVKNYSYYASGQLGNIETLYYSYDQIIESDANDYYYYDGNGQRVRKVTTGGVTKYYYTGSSVLVTLDESNNKTSENIISVGGDIIAGKRFEGMYTDKWYFYDYDLRGSVTSILDPDGVYTSGYQYDAFGNTARKGDSDFKNEMEFIGCVADKSSGLYYMNARYYNPKTGRFLTQDAMGGDQWTNNLYAYCGNNPVNFIDPTGYFYYIGTTQYASPIPTSPSQNNSGSGSSGNFGGGGGGGLGAEPTTDATTHPDQAAADAEEALKTMTEDLFNDTKDAYHHVYDALGKTPNEIMDEIALGVIPDTVFYLWGLDIWKNKVEGRQRALISNLWNVGMEEYYKDYPDKNYVQKPYVIYLMASYKIDDAFRYNAKGFYGFANVQSSGTVSSTQFKRSYDYCQTQFENLNSTQQKYLIGAVGKMHWGGQMFNEAVMPDIDGVIYDAINFIYNPTHMF